MLDRKITTILFDFDGTLADTLPVVTKIGNQMLVEAGRQPIDPKDFEAWRAKGARKFLADLHIPIWRAPQLLRHIQAEMGSQMESLPVFPALDQVLFDLRARGRYKMGVVTTNTAKNLDDFFHGHKFPAFDFIYSGSSIFGKARVLKGLIKKYGLVAAETIYVADETRDIEAAHAVGMPIISVTWGYNNAEALKPLSPEYMVSAPEELRELFLSNA